MGLLDGMSLKKNKKTTLIYYELCLTHNEFLRKSSYISTSLEFMSTIKTDNNGQYYLNSRQNSRTKPWRVVFLEG